MANMQINTPTDLMDQLLKLSNQIDVIAPLMLDEAIEPLHKQMIASAIKHKKTGEMLKGLKVNKAIKDKKGVWRKKIFFDGYDRTKLTPVPNAIKVFAIEYGSSQQEATPFIRPSVAITENQVNEKMQEVFNREVDRL